MNIVKQETKHHDSADSQTIVVRRGGHPGPLHSGTCRTKITRAYKRTAQTGTPQLVVEFEATEEPDRGKFARAYIALTPAAALVLDYFVRAVFPEVAGDGDLEFEPDDLVGRPVKIEVEWPDDRPYPQVTRYYPI